MNDQNITNISYIIQRSIENKDIKLNTIMFSNNVYNELLKFDNKLNKIKAP